ncbi:MAG: alkaline phosphatase [Planctomycetota bacterium]|jgi:alkaline phosphatase
MQTPIRSILLWVFLLLPSGLFSCQFPGEPTPSAPGPDSSKIKNVIIVIADGMGPQALGLLAAYAKYAPNSVYAGKGRITAVERAVEAGTLGLAHHEVWNVLAADSAASATQMATGKWALPETVGIDRHGKPAETLLEMAKKGGKATGLVSDARITHATPAGFAAHRTHRSKENEIAGDLLTAGVDVMLSGGLRHWIPKDAADPGSENHVRLKARTGGAIEITSKRKDDRNLLDEAEKRGYTLAFTKKQLRAFGEGKILGLFCASALPYRIDFDPEGTHKTVPTLREMTSKALRVLSINEKGFFLMVESGLIDWSGHDNDAGALLHELIRFDETLDCILAWMEGRKDTLCVVTADHETGGFGFSYSRRNLPESEDFPGNHYPGESFAPQFNFGSVDLLDGIYGQKRSFQHLLDTFDALPESERTAENLAVIVNRNLAFPITVSEAAAVLEREENEYRVEGHKYLSAETFPKINDFKEFYVYGEEVRKDILGRIVARQQHTVWSSGTHTSTPVPLIVLGPESVRKGFGKLMHTTAWARRVIPILKGETQGDAPPNQE